MKNALIGINTFPNDYLDLDIYVVSSIIYRH